MASLLGSQRRPRRVAQACGVTRGAKAFHKGILRNVRGLVTDVCGPDGDIVNDEPGSRASALLTFFTQPPQPIPSKANLILFIALSSAFKPRGAPIHARPFHRCPCAS
jgi:hypothetical protein